MLTKIAGKLDLTPQFVGQVLRGKRRSDDGRVEKALAKAGAPGFATETN